MKETNHFFALITFLGAIACGGEHATKTKVSFAEGVVVLVAPNGTETILHDRTGGSYDNLVIRDFNVGTIDARAVSGTWRLIVRDRDARDIGTLDRWSLSLN